MAQPRGWTPPGPDPAMTVKKKMLIRIFLIAIDYDYRIMVILSETYTKFYIV